MAPEDSYTADNIQVLEGLEAVRKRPGMYIGSTGERGLHHLVYEVVDNSVDEALAGFCTEIGVTVRKDNSITVTDNGRGIPTDTMKEYGISAMEVVMTKLHAGGKFSKSSYKVSGGLHGVGISVVNALSEGMVVRVFRKGKVYSQEFSRGKKLSEVKIENYEDADRHGTEIHFKPDSDIFESVIYDASILANRLRELAFLNAGLKIIFTDERNGDTVEFQYDGGLKKFVEYINEGKQQLHEPIHILQEKEDVAVEIAIQYNQSFSESLFSFVNNINTIEGGSHLTGFRSALTRALNSYAQKYMQKEAKNISLSGNDVREGLAAIVSVKVQEPQFEGQTKTKLGNSEVKGIVDSIVFAALSAHFDENPSVARNILDKCFSSARAREAAQKARDLIRRKSVLESSALPGKLADCSTKDKSKAELFIVEGDSAGGSAKQARSREFQAILPLRGKILNVEKSQLNRAIKNKEIQALITAIGTSVNDDFDISRLRYGKIIIMTDADVDGAHIATLLLTFFFRYMRELIDDGRIYMAQPPLYKVQKGRKFTYLFSDEQLRKALESSEYSGAGVQRYKGLGEMNPQQLWETTMDPEVRKMVQVNVDDAIYADKLFTILMGSEVEPRRDFIEKHAAEVQDLDL